MGHTVAHNSFHNEINFNFVGVRLERRKAGMRGEGKREIGYIGEGIFRRNR